MVLRLAVVSLVVGALANCADKAPSVCGKLGAAHPTKISHPSHWELPDAYPKLTNHPSEFWKLPDVEVPDAIKNKVLMCFQHNGPLNSLGKPAYPNIDFMKRQAGRYVIILRDEGLSDTYFVIFVSTDGEISGSGHF